MKEIITRYIQIVVFMGVIIYIYDTHGRDLVLFVGLVALGLALFVSIETSFK
jgi:hypothetical protein